MVKIARGTYLVGMIIALCTPMAAADDGAEHIKKGLEAIRQQDYDKCNRVVHEGDRGRSEETELASWAAVLPAASRETPTRPFSTIPKRSVLMPQRASGGYRPQLLRANLYARRQEVDKATVDYAAAVTSWTRS